MKQSIPTVKGTIIFVSNNCWSLFNFRKPLLTSFLQQGFRVVTIAAEDGYSKEIRAMGCIYYKVNFRNNTVSPVRDIRLFYVLRSIYRKENPGIIFHYVTKPCIYGSFAAGTLGIPSISVITGLGYVFSGNNWLQSPVRFLFRKAMVHAKEVWFLNRENADYFTSHQIVPENKIRILPGEGIDTGWFLPMPVKTPNEQMVFIMVTRLLWSKGIGIYVEAARMLRSSGTKATFRLLGKPYAGHPEAIAAERLSAWEKEGILQNMEYTDDVRKSLSEADCLVLPTYYEEGLPRTLLEACSMGIPCITTNHTGSNTVIADQVNGLLCRPRDAEDLADKMTRMIMMTEEQRREMGKKGREKMISEFELTKVIAIYQQVISHYYPA